ncbi:hypothetical protein Tco_0582959 [Tanacetum coccineum]
MWDNMVFSSLLAKAVATTKTSSPKPTSTPRSYTTTQSKGKKIVRTPSLPSDLDKEDLSEKDLDQTQRDKDMHKAMVLLTHTFQHYYKPTTNHLRTLSNTKFKYFKNTTRTNKNTRNERVLGQTENQRNTKIVGNIEKIRKVMQQTMVKCYNYNDFGHMAKECRAGKRVKDLCYHKKKMLLAKREEAGGKLSAEEHDWLIDLDGEEENHEMEAYYIYMAKIQEALLETNNDTRPSYYIKSLLEVQSTNEYNVFANERENVEQPESINDTYVMELGDISVTLNLSYMNYS